MVLATAWSWPHLPVGIDAVQRDGSVVVLPAVPIVVFAPTLLALVTVLVAFSQHLRRRVSVTFSVPLWRSDTTHRYMSNTALLAVSFVFIGLHAMALAITIGRHLTDALTILDVCIGLSLVVIARGFSAPQRLTPEQSAFLSLLSHKVGSLTELYLAGSVRSMGAVRIVMAVAGVITIIAAPFDPTKALYIPVAVAFAMLIPLATGVMRAMRSR